MSAPAQEQLLKPGSNLQQELSSFLSQYLEADPPPMIDRHLSTQLLPTTTQSKDVILMLMT